MNQSKYKIAIAANFTIEPIEKAIGAMEMLGQEYELAFAPYNQVFQQLADPTSVISTNANGANAIFIRLESLFESDTSDSASAQLDKINSSVDELCSRLAGLGGFASPHFLFTTPHSRSVIGTDFARSLTEIEDSLVRRLQDISNLFIVKSDGFCERYRVAEYDNPKGLELGRVPYTQSFYDAMGWELCRKVDAAKRPPFKVIVLDCDNTLWDGVCGEDGIDGVGISESRRFLQNFAVSQREQGMLITLCSKNNEQDVWDLFDTRKDMVLKREHISASRINWEPKSINIRALSEELQLGLDSFIFIDDDAAVCAEVIQNCPSVLTIQLPAVTADITQLFEHLWCFDGLKRTEEDALRAASYSQQAQRRELRDKAKDFASFLESLEVHCDIIEITDEQIPRVSQLSLRTNQFNSTTVRRSEFEIAKLPATPGNTVWTVNVRDRFGDYGLTGVIIFSVNKKSLDVESLMLSCRVLGRGVEHQILRTLAEKARSLAVADINIQYRRSAMNAPFLAFLKSIQGTQIVEDDELHYVSVPIEVAERLEPGTSAGEVLVSSNAVASASDGNALVEANWKKYVLIAEHLSNEQPVSSARRELDRTNLSSHYRSPISNTEIQIVGIWERLLEVSPIGLDDDFFSLGGDSLLAVTLFVEVENVFGVTLPLTTLIASPTIAGLAAAVSSGADNSAWEYIVPLQAKGNRNPLFCMHAAGGNVLFYRDLAAELGDEQPLYGIQARGVADKAKTAHDSLEAMASAYLREIRRIQSVGPYWLCGSSFGGLIAFEAAKQLRLEDEQVEFLGLFDTYAPGYAADAEKSQDVSRGNYVLNKLRNIRDQVAEIPSASAKLRFVWGKFMKFRNRRNRKAIWNKNQFEIEYAKKTGLELPVDIRRNHKAIENARTSYAPEPYDGSVVLFRAEQQPVGADPQLGWEKYITGQIVTRTVKGTHGALTVYPFASDLSKQLDPFLTSSTQVDRSDVEYSALVAETT